MRRVTEESMLQDLPAIEFRDGVTGRRASVRGGPDVWEIVMVQRDYGDDREGLYRHFGWLARGDVDQALIYAERFAASIGHRIAQNERVAGELAQVSSTRPGKAAKRST